MATTARRTVLTLPAAPLGEPNPLPALRPLDEVHTLDERAKQDLPRDMARQIGAEILGEVWSELTDEPLPDAYDYRMRPQD